MSRRRRSREVEIFNFSFLDILACTIGLLIFIMVMVFILQSNSPVADPAEIIGHKLDEAATLRAAAERDARITRVLESAFDEVRAPQEPDLTPQRDAARAARDAARARYDGLVQQVAAAQGRLDEARLTQSRAAASDLAHARADLAAAQQRHDQAQADLAALIAAAKVNAVTLSPYQPLNGPAEAVEVLHVDCQAGVVVVLKSSDDGRIVQVGQTDTGDLQDPTSDYQRLIAAHRELKHGLVLFWVRPNAADTFAKARDHLPPDTRYGFEPADAGWSFKSTSR